MTSIRNHPIAALAVLVLGLFMTLLDLTIVNIAIPSILDGLHASLDQVLWVLNAYSLLYAVLLITSARLGDIYGPRNLFAVGVVIFTIASGLSAFAQDPTQLIVSRALQGVGAAVLAPQGLPLMMSLFPLEKRGGVFAIYGVMAGLAVVAGPTVGGFLVTHFGWRSIFTVNLPIGIITFALALLLIPDLRPGRRHRLDLAGVALATAGLLGVIYGLIEGQRYDWGVVTGFITIPEIIAAGVATLALFLVYQARRQAAEPLLTFEVFRDRNFTLMTLVMAAMGFAILGIYLPLTIYMQSVLGLTAIDAGLTIALQPLAMIVSSGVASGLVQKVNGKYLLIPGLLALAAGTGYIDWAAHANSGRWDFVPGLVLSGLGMGCIWTPVFSIATRDLRPDLAGVASGVINTIQELGGVIASAAVGAFLQNRLALALHDQAVAASGRLPEQYRAAFVDGFSNAAHSGFEVGAGQTGASLQLPAQVQAVAHYVFTHAFVDAMHPTMLLPIAILVLAAAASVFVRGPRRAEEAVREREAAVA
ncbi:MAG TPA: DHA2 family efflux MFS transporter permease subunit [Candidatus Dormibacteraeota bacterium]